MMAEEGLGGEEWPRGVPCVLSICLKQALGRCIKVLGGTECTVHCIGLGYDEQGGLKCDEYHAL